MLLHTVTSKLREAQTRSSFADDLIGLLGGLVDEGLVDVGDHTTAGDGRLDEGVELLVTTDGELKVAGGDALDLWFPVRAGGDVSGARRRRKKRNGQKNRFVWIQTRLDGLSSGRVPTPNGNAPVTGAGGWRERRCRRGAP